MKPYLSLLVAMPFFAHSANCAEPQYRGPVIIQSGSDGRHTITDVNEDGLPDMLAAAGNGLQVLLAVPTNRHGYLTFNNSLTLPGSYPGPLIDVDGDGDKEILAFSPFGLHYLLKPSETQTFWETVYLLSLSGIRAVHALQYDGVGREEILLRDGNSVRIYKFGVAPAHTPELLHSFPLTADSTICVTDIDKDGKVEIITYLGSGATAHGYDGSNTEQPILTPLSGIGPFQQLVPSDLNGDGRTDFIGRDGTITLYLNTGDDLTFQPIVTDLQAVGVAIGDLDLDTVPDILTLKPNGDNMLSMYVHYLRSLEPFVVKTANVTGSIIPNPSTISLADLDSDGDLEVVWHVVNRLQYLDTAPHIQFFTGWVADDDGDAVWLATEETRLVFFLENKSDQAIPVDIKIEPPPGVVMQSSTLSLPPIAPSATRYEFSMPFRIEPEAGCGSIGFFWISLEEGGRKEAISIKMPPLGNYERHSVFAQEKPSFVIPDAYPPGVTRTLNLQTGTGVVSRFELMIDIRDVPPGGITFALYDPDGSHGPLTLKSVQKDHTGVYTVPSFRHRPYNGDFTLRVIDQQLGNTGTLAYWSISAEYGDYECRDPEIAQSLWMILDLRAGTGQQGDLNRDGALDSADMVYPGLGE